MRDLGDPHSGLIKPSTNCATQMWEEAQYNSDPGTRDGCDRVPHLGGGSGARMVLGGSWVKKKIDTNYFEVMLKILVSATCDR